MRDTNAVLVVARWNDPALSLLERMPHVVCGDLEGCAQSARDATIILNWFGTRDLLRPLFPLCNKLQWLHSCSAGLDQQLFPELVESEVVVTNGSGVFSASLAEFAMGAVLHFAKDFRQMLSNQAAGIWKPFEVEDIGGKILGIVGYGDIGRAVAKRAQAFGMRVLATKKHLPANDPVVETFYRREALREMLPHCDYVVVTAPLTEETRHMMSDDEFEAMKATAVIINVGRGPVIDQEALVRALTAKKIKGAGLDVFEEEPLPAGHPLYAMENVLLSPHCADHAADWKERVVLFFLEQYARFCSGKPLLNVVNKQLGY